MTTIAYKDGVIGFDSRLTSDNLIVSDNYKKYVIIDGIYFFYSGATCDREAFVNAYINKFVRVDRNLDGNALIVDKNQLYFTGVNRDLEFWIDPINTDDIYAIGSGKEFAFAYMDCGLDAGAAVRATARRDSSTGGAIRVFDLESKTFSIISES